MDRVKAGYQAQFRRYLKQNKYQPEYIEDQVINYRSKIDKLHTKNDIIEFNKEYSTNYRKT